MRKKYANGESKVREWEGKAMVRGGRTVLCEYRSAETRVEAENLKHEEKTQHRDENINFIYVHSVRQGP